MLVDIKDYSESEDNRVKVVVHAHDVYSLDWTLAQIIAPALKQLKEKKHGAPNVSDEDVPEHLRSISAPPKENEWDTDANWFDRWEYALDEMIYAMEEIANDKPSEPDMFRRVGEMEFGEIGTDGLGTLTTGLEIIPEMQEVNKAYHERIRNGCRLFGSYYQSLWS